MNITIHDCFAAAFHLFGILWPAIGALIPVAAGILIVRGFAALWTACVSRFDEEESTYSDEC